MFATPPAHASAAVALAPFRIDVKVVAAERMPLLAYFPLSVPDKPRLGFRVLHVVFSRSGEQVIGIHAERRIADMARVMSFRHVNANRLKSQMRYLSSPSLPCPNGVFVFASGNAALPQPASRIFFDAVV